MHKTATQQKRGVLSSRLNSITETFNEQSDADMSSLEKKRKNSRRNGSIGQTHSQMERSHRGSLLMGATIKEEDELISNADNSTVKDKSRDKPQGSSSGDRQASNMLRVDSSRNLQNLTKKNTITSRSAYDNPLSSYTYNQNTQNPSTMRNSGNIPPQNQLVNPSQVLQRSQTKIPVKNQAQSSTQIEGITVGGAHLQTISAGRQGQYQRTQTMFDSNQPSKMMLKESYHYDGSVMNGQSGHDKPPVIRIFEEQDISSGLMTLSNGLIGTVGGQGAKIDSRKYSEGSPINQQDQLLKNQLHQIYQQNPMKANEIQKQIMNSNMKNVREQEELQKEFSVIHEETGSKYSDNTIANQMTPILSQKQPQFNNQMQKEQVRLNQMLIIEKSSLNSSSQFEYASSGENNKMPDKTSSSQDYNMDRSIQQKKVNVGQKKKVPNQNAYQSQMTGGEGGSLLEVPESPEKQLSLLLGKNKNAFNYEQIPAQYLDQIQVTQIGGGSQKQKRQLIQPSKLEKDPFSGAYKPQDINDMVELREMGENRSAAFKLKYFQKKEQSMSLLRLEMKNKVLREAEERKKDQIHKYLMIDNMEQERGPKFPQIEKTKFDDAKRIQFENMQSQVMNNIYYDPQQYKNLLMKFICEGYTSEVKRLLREAPDEPAFLDSREFYFGMFMHSLEKSKESKMISPIAVAVNVGDYDLVDELLNTLHNVNVEFGLETKMKASTILKQNQNNTVRKRSPLQYACSLGLYQIVERLLQAGANPNNVPEDERMSLIEYGPHPLVICMNPKHYNQDLTIDGLTYKRKYTPLKDVDHEQCLKLLLKYKAEPNSNLGFQKKRRPKPIFHALKQSRMLKVFLEMIDDKIEVVNSVNFYQETPLCIVASEPGGQDSDFKVSLLLKAGASSFASELNPLHIAIKNKNYKVMRLLHKQGDANPSRNLNNELSPVQLAIRHQDANLFRELLSWKEKEIDFEFQDDQGRNLLHCIAQNKSIDIFKSLVSETKNQYLKRIKEALNVTTDESQPYLTPLYFCFPSIELARMFQRYGSDPSKLSFLHCFFTYSKPQVWQSEDLLNPKNHHRLQYQPATPLDFLKFLVKELGLDIDETDVDGKSALVHAYEDYRKDTMAYLISQGADLEIGCLGPSGKTMLLDAFHKGYKDLVSFLLDKGASIEAKDFRGKTCSDYIKTDYEGKTLQMKQDLQQLLYKHTLSKPFKKEVQRSQSNHNQVSVMTTRDNSVNNSQQKNKALERNSSQIERRKQSANQLSQQRNVSFALDQQEKRLPNLNQNSFSQQDEAQQDLKQNNRSMLLEKILKQQGYQSIPSRNGAMIMNNQSQILNNNSNLNRSLPLQPYPLTQNGIGSSNIPYQSYKQGVRHHYNGQNAYPLQPRNYL